MKRLLLTAILTGILMLITGTTRAADRSEVFRGTDNDDAPAVVRIFLDQPCTNEKVRAVLKEKVKDEFVSQFKAGVTTWKGTDYQMCWLESNGRVFSYDEAGDPFNPPHGLPRNGFKDELI